MNNRERNWYEGEHGQHPPTCSCHMCREAKRRIIEEKPMEKRRYKSRKKKKGLLKNRHIRDFLLGTLSKILQVALIGVGIFLVISGLIDDPLGRLLIGRIIGGVVCLCASFGVRYALGAIIRVRY